MISSHRDIYSNDIYYFILYIYYFVNLNTCQLWMATGEVGVNGVSAQNHVVKDNRLDLVNVTTLHRPHKGNHVCLAARILGTACVSSLISKVNVWQKQIVAFTLD